MQIDLNCDIGESFGQYVIGNDAAILPFLTSCNIACGFHGGDPMHIENTIALALGHDVIIGAHPSYPDLQGFGRRFVKMEKKELKACLKYQIAALKGLVESQRGALKYVKPHGALYNYAAKDADEAFVILEALREMDGQLALMGLAGSTVQYLCEKEQVLFIAEAFADRRYEPDGSLMHRSKIGSVIYDAGEAADQVLSIIMGNRVKTADGSYIPLSAKSICIHGDNPNAVVILEKIDMELKRNNIAKKPFLR